MTREHLENLARTGELRPEAMTQPEFEGLVRSALVRLKDAESGRLSLESRFDLAYNAAHALSLAALRWHGYRSQKRYLVFQCLKHTIGLLDAHWRVLDQAHRKRNLAEYEGELDVDDELVAALVRITREVAERVAVLAPPSPS